MRRHGERGQHIGEYAVVIGMAAVAVLSTQSMVRRAISEHLATAGAAVLGSPGSVDGTQQNRTASGADVTGNGATRVTRFGAIRQGSESSGFILAEPAGPFTKINLARALKNFPGAIAFVTELDRNGDRDFLGPNGELQFETDKDGNLVRDENGRPVFIEVEDGKTDVLPIDAAGQFAIDQFLGGRRALPYADFKRLAETVSDPEGVKDGSWKPTDAIVLLDTNGDGPSHPDAIDTNGDWKADWTLVPGWSAETTPPQPPVSVGDRKGRVGVSTTLFSQSLTAEERDLLLPNYVPAQVEQASAEAFSLRDLGNAQGTYRNLFNKKQDGYDAQDAIDVNHDGTPDLAQVIWVEVEQDGPASGTLFYDADWEYAKPGEIGPWWEINTDDREFGVKLPGIDIPHGPKREDAVLSHVKPAAYADIKGADGKPGADGLPDVAAIYLDEAVELGFLGPPDSEVSTNLVLDSNWQPAELVGGVAVPIRPQPLPKPAWLSWWNNFLRLNDEAPAGVMLVSGRGDGIKNVAIITHPDGTQDVEYAIPAVLLPPVE